MCLWQRMRSEIARTSNTSSIPVRFVFKAFISSFIPRYHRDCLCLRLLHNTTHHTSTSTSTTAAIMAAVAFSETPERVLLRVQQLEDVELPSLPSFQHDHDYDSEAATSFDATSNLSGNDSEVVGVLDVFKTDFSGSSYPTSPQTTDLSVTQSRHVHWRFVIRV